MTVQSAILKLLQRIDPRLSDGTEITASNISTWASDGATFTAQRIMDIYNEARFVLANTISRTYPERQVSEELAGLIKKKTDFQFSSGSADKTTLTGFVRIERLYTSGGTQITVLPVEAMQRTEDLNTSSNPVVYDYGTVFAQKSADTSIIPNASTYVIWYHGVTTFTTTDVTGGSTKEEFRDDWIPALIQLAQAISQEQGRKSINALAEQLVSEGR